MQFNSKDIIIVILILSLLMAGANYLIDQISFRNWINKKEENRKPRAQKLTRGDCIQRGERKIKKTKRNIKRQKNKFLREVDYGYNPYLEVCGFYIKTSKLISSRVTVEERLENLFTNNKIATSTYRQGLQKQKGIKDLKINVFLGKPTNPKIRSWDQYMEVLDIKN
ncbi:MAG: hypothetical protein ABEI53_01995 [Candidatus Magasanikbacteria bacterium]